MADINPTILSTHKISKLLVQYSIPAVIGMIATSLYNVIDSIYIGLGVGALAISGLAITFPLMNLMAAFGSLVGAGGSTMISIKMGQKDNWGATKILGHVVLLNIIIGLSITLITLPFLDKILYFFGASESTISYAHDYMVIILIGNTISHLYFGLNNVIRSSGYPKKSMTTTLLTVVLNAILDPIFIFVLGWGIQGVAVATILSQFIVLIWELYHFSLRKSYIHFKKGIYKLNKRIVISIFSIGVSPFLLNMCSCLVVVLINQALGRHGGDMAIGAYGIANRFIMIFAMVVLGINQGMQPIAGYNFGAKLYGRVREVLKTTLILGTIVTTIAFLAGEFAPRFLTLMFTRDEELIELTVQAFRVMVLVFPIVGISMVTSNFFQSIGKAKKAVFLSSTRQLLFLVPFLLILPNHYGLMGVWICMPISDLASTILAVYLLCTEKTLSKHNA